MWSRFATATITALFIILSAPLAYGQAPKKDKIGIGTQIWPGALPIYVALAKGLFDENHIEVERVLVASGGSRRAALLAGEIDFAEFAFSNVAVAAARGAGIKYVMSTHDYETFSLIVRSELKDKVKTIADLKGRTVGFTTPGAGAWAFARIFLIEGGLKPEVDVKLVGGMSETGVILTALKTAKIDAYPSWEPVTSTAIAEDIAFPLIPIWEPEVHRKWVGPTALGSGLSTTEKVIREKPEVVRRAVAAIRGGLKTLNSAAPEEIAKLLATNQRTSEHWSRFKPQVLADMIRKSRAVFQETDGRMSKSGVEQELKLALDVGIIKKPLTFEDVVDAQFIGTKP